jgi:hypothetical protein
MSLNPQQDAFMAHRDKTEKVPFGKPDFKGAKQDGAEDGHSEHDHEGQEGDHEVIKGVVAEHGPAKEVKHEHDHEAGVHHVHSVHEDGHEHHSKNHPSVEHALEHHKHAAGEYGGDEKEAGSEEHEDLEDEAATDLNQAGHPGKYHWSK